MKSEKDAVKISLQDCLACSGCVTSAETVLLEHQSIGNVPNISHHALLLPSNLQPTSYIYRSMIRGFISCASLCRSDNVTRTFCACLLDIPELLFGLSKLYSITWSFTSIELRSGNQIQNFVQALKACQPWI